MFLQFDAGGFGVYYSGAVSPTALLVVQAGVETRSGWAGGVDGVAAASSPVICTVPAHAKEKVATVLSLNAAPAKAPSAIAAPVTHVASAGGAKLAAAGLAAAAPQREAGAAGQAQVNG